ncbi:hypothetical protein AB733_23090 [Photobacterium swingsii]|uniref:Uncharacterized protein n=1 Tax=Photobacterium swingsii TaxID=680026 RepID=A0A0J8V549_9GAMM|nr:hypothetical protein AB733_23090 [Photobacterium swingsii]PSW24534.1 hypothetical protein C9I94_10890 [Photobacterium swingsii]
MIVVLFGFVVLGFGCALFVISVLSIFEHYKLTLTPQAAWRALIIAIFLMISGFAISPLWFLQMAG